MRPIHDPVCRVVVLLSLAATVITLTPPVLGQANLLARGGPSTKPATLRYQRYAITDDSGFKGVEIFHGVMPIDWTVKGGVTWKMGLLQPDLIRVHFGDAQDLRAFDVYPFVGFAWSTAAERGMYQPGQVVIGYIVQKTPADQFEAFDKVIVQMFRPDLANAKVVNKEKVPEAAKKLYEQLKQSDPDSNNEYAVAVGRETFEYELQGRTVQEEISGAFTASRYRMNNPTAITHWSVLYASSKRAAKGQLDELAPISSVMVQSLQMNPVWANQLADLLKQREQQALAAQRQQAIQQQNQFNAIEARIGAQTAANDAQHQSYWQHSADLARQSENRADVMREVSPWRTSDGSTYKLPTQYGHAWSGANGEIIMNNDPTYNPNSDPSLTSTNWTPMEPTHN